MAFNGSGVFQRLYNWVNDAAANIKIRADRMDAEMDGFATGLSTCITKDGQTTVTANLPMAGFRHTGVGNAVARNNYASFAQVQDGVSAWADAGGTADAITATYSIPITALVDGQMCFVRASAANATTTPTFSPNGLTARTIVKQGGVALAASDIRGDGHELILRYDLANTRWELLNPAVNFSSYVTLTGSETLTNKTISAAANTISNVLNYLAGLTLSNNVSDATNDIDIAAGSASADATPFSIMALTASITKRLDAAWAVGTGNGGLDTGSIANGTYHVWLIQRSDTGVVDALFSTSATSPTMPANYDRKRRIGSIIRSGGAILAFKQFGDKFRFVTPITDVSVVSSGTSAVSRTLTVPSGIVVDANVLLNYTSGGTANAAALLTALDETDSAPTTTFNHTNIPTISTNGSGADIFVRTNTSSQIRSRENVANGTIIIRTLGWIDTRGA